MSEIVEVKSRSYTLRGENGEWLGQVVLTTDGMFASVTDYGNLSYSWRSFGSDFREFICSLNTSYFGSKLYSGMTYIAYSRKVEKACDRFAEMILPALQKALKEEIESEKLCQVNSIDIDGIKRTKGYKRGFDRKSCSNCTCCFTNAQYVPKQERQTLCSKLETPFEVFEDDTCDEHIEIRYESKD